MKKIAICFIFFVVFFCPVFAKDIAMPPLTIPTAASSGFGGTHIAYTDNVFALLVNPAAMIRVQQRSFFALAPSLMSPQFISNLTRYTKDVFGAMTDEDFNTMGDALGKMADEIGDQEGKMALGIDIREFPMSVAWVANGFGFGIWSRAFLNTNVEGHWVSANIFLDMIFPLGFAFKILELDNHTVDAGITAKPFFRTMITGQSAITSLLDDSSDFANQVNSPILMGLGFDMGFLYRWDAGLSAGLTLNDLFSSSSEINNLNSNNIGEHTYYVPFSLNLGLAYDFRLSNFWTDIPALLDLFSLTLALDWRNIINVFQQDDYLNNRNAALDIGVGLQLAWFDIFKFRIGMNEMLPAVGLGFHLGPIEIDLAYYGKELGMEPGQLSAAMVDLSIALRPGAKARNWPWTWSSIVGLFKE
jgi:hypothetical protein